MLRCRFILFVLVGLSSQVWAQSSTDQAVTDQAIQEALNSIEQLNGSSAENCAPSVSPFPKMRPTKAPEISNTNFANRFAKTGLSQLFREGMMPPGPGGSWPCEIFVKDNGEYGPTGKTIEKYIKDPQSKFHGLISDESASLPSMKKVCPGMAHMNSEERVNVIVWAMASIAWDETKCGTILKNPANPEAVGLFQMNKTEADRDWRGVFCEGDSLAPHPEAADPHGLNTLCALEILQGSFSGKYSGKDMSRRGLYPDAYWEKLRPPFSNKIKDSTILTRLHSHPGCRLSAPASSPIPPMRPKPQQEQQPNNESAFGGGQSNGNGAGGSW